jgi:hypothetical protein
VAVVGPNVNINAVRLSQDLAGLLFEEADGQNDLHISPSAVSSSPTHFSDVCVSWKGTVLPFVVRQLVTLHSQIKRRKKSKSFGVTKYCSVHDANDGLKFCATNNKEV